MAVRMELSRILIRELNDYQIIELREMAGEDGGGGVGGGGGGNGGNGNGAAGAEPDGVESLRAFPIVIGLPEAQAIERRIKGIQIKRPQTHDLLASVITSLGGVLESITISDLTDHTFFASLNVRKGGELIHIDSRPSDAIALGVANDVPIYVEEHVIEAAINEEP